MQSITLTAPSVTDLTDAWDIALHIMDAPGINDVTRGQNGTAIIHRTDGERMVIDIEVDHYEHSAEIGGWAWATYGADGENTGQGGDAIANAADVEAVAEEIRDWASHAA